MRALVIVTSLALLVILFSGSALVSGALAHQAISAPLDPNLPNEQALIARGLSGVPGSDQPTQPVAVDRVVVDGAQTYVQYHITDHMDWLGPGFGADPLPVLTDDRSIPVAQKGAAGSLWMERGLAPIPSWLPWRPPTIRRGDLIMGSLPAAAHGAILRFAGGESVHVPLDLHPLATLRVSHPRARAQAYGIVLTTPEVSDSYLGYAYTLPARTSAAPWPMWLATATHRVLPVVASGSACQTGPRGTRCQGVVTFPPQRPGTRLIFTIPTFEVEATDGWRGRTGPLPGSWRLMVIAP